MADAIPNGKTVKYIVQVAIGVVVIIMSGYIGSRLEKAERTSEQVIINTQKLKAFDPLPGQIQEVREAVIALRESMASVKYTVEKMEQKLDKHMEEKR